MKKGFTLSEVLITLEIVGIVAVLTIPAIMKNYKNKLYVSQLQKVYSQMADATKAIMSEEQAENFYETTAGVPNSCSDANNGVCEKGAGYFLNNYFKVIKSNCGNVNQANACIATSYKNMAGANIGSISREYCVQTTNGAAICMSLNPNNRITTFHVDVNGTSPPNTAGLDFFAIDMDPMGNLTDYWSGSCKPEKCNTDGKEAPASWACGCLNSIIEAGWKITY